MKRKLLTVVGVLVLAAGGATLAWATTSADSNTITACVAKNGKVSIYPAGQSCLASEHTVSWNVQGPPGPQGPAGPPAAQTFTGAIDGSLTISGANFGPAIEVIAVSHEIISPRDPASGLPTGKRQHQPFVVTKPLDASTPLLMEAQFTNQTLPAVQVTLDDANGKPEATVVLTNAHVVDNSQSGGYQTIQFTYQKITWTWIDGGNTASDDWDPGTTG